MLKTFIKLSIANILIAAIAVFIGIYFGIILAELVFLGLWGTIIYFYIFRINSKKFRKNGF
jgi:hypothetical protein